jgi:hypothetical protein
MVFSQIEHLVKMANDLYLNMTWSTTLCIYFLPSHPPIYLVKYLLVSTHPPTSYLPIPSHLPIYIPTYVFQLHITYLFIEFNH